MAKLLCTALAFVIADCGMASAAVIPPLSQTPQTESRPFVLIANGCGRGYFRTIAGACMSNQRIETRRGVVAPPPCPRGYLRDPDPARPLCYPIY